jgi:hypothetical protein
MAISAPEFKFRKAELQCVPCQETSRIIGFYEWLQEDAAASRVLTELEAVDVATLLKNRVPGEAPKPKSPVEVAAIGLYVIKNCGERSCQLHSFSNTLGTAPSSPRLQGHADAVLSAYIHPFVNYIEKGLFQDLDMGSIRKEITMSNRTDIFIVHGRDEAAKQTVARFIEKLGLRPIILHEQRNCGLTLIEKFEESANVLFSVILLTPDDVGRLTGEPESSNEHRARQNVVLEMGYFIGRIGRDRVFLLKKAGVEIPSDYGGIVYTEMDSGNGWKQELLRELKGAGFAGGGAKSG